jgi:hypothetical protein
MTAQHHCWGGREAAGVLRCWQGGSGALVERRDDRDGGCDIALLGRQWHCWGMRAVAGMEQWAQCFWGRRAVVSGLEREVTINMLLGWVCGKVRGWGGHGICHSCHQT